MMATYNWKFLKKVNDRSPYIYNLISENNANINIQYSPANSTVRIQIDANNKSALAIIHDGKSKVERDLLNNTVSSDEIQAFLSLYSDEISSIPNPAILKTINGHYSVNKSFKGKVKVTKYYTLEPKVQSINFISKLLEKLLVAIRHFFISLFSWLTKLLFVPKFTLPSKRDITSVLIICILSYCIYLINFDYLLSGFFLLLVSFSLVFYDLLFTKQEPYIPKVLLLLTLGFSGVFTGLFLQ